MRALPTHNYQVGFTQEGRWRVRRDRWTLSSQRKINLPRSGWGITCEVEVPSPLTPALVFPVHNDPGGLLAPPLP